jgi:hypothetical protein
MSFSGLNLPEQDDAHDGRCAIQQVVTGLTPWLAGQVQFRCDIKGLGAKSAKVNEDFRRTAAPVARSAQ